MACPLSEVLAAAIAVVTHTPVCVYVLTLFDNIRLTKKNLTVKNTVAYIAAALVKNKKSLITLTPGTS
jgi:hypothetical protein